MMASEMHTKARNLSAALAVVCLVIGGEYFFRHYVLFWMPTLEALVVNDIRALWLSTRFSPSWG